MKFIYSLLLAVFLTSTPLSAAAQQTDRDLYIGLYRNGQNQKAAEVLKRITKKDPADGMAWYYLGLVQLKLEKEKDAVKSFERAVELRPADKNARTGLAWAYLLRNDRKASDAANEALKLDENNAQAHYIIGVRSARNEVYDDAYERAKKAIELDPKFAAAYSLKSEALLGSFAKQHRIVRPSESRHELLAEAASDLEKYLAIAPNPPDLEFRKELLKSLKFFSTHYARPGSKPPSDPADPSQPAPNSTRVKILEKPRPQYTDRARNNLVEGEIRLLVGFDADGTIGHILVLRPLGYGLDQEAVRAARRIKFEPATVDGKPVPSVLQVFYTFDIY